jgi:hypothetical protein
MPKFSTPAGTTQRYIPGFDRASPDSIPGTKKVYADRAAFLQGIADERACIAMGLPVWYDGIDVQVLSEPPAVKRLWTLATGAGSPANNAAASHGRTVVIAFKKFTLASDDNRVHASTGAPASGLGDNGDLCLDDAAGVVYRKVTGAWAVEANFGSGSGLPNQIAASTVIPLTGNAIMAKQSIAGPTTFTLGAMAPGGSCVVQTLSDGVNAPVWPGIEWESTFGYDNSQSGLLNTASYFTFDGVTAYYIQGKPTGQTPVDGTAPTFSSASVTEGQTKIVATFNEALSATLTGNVTLGGPARTLVSQIVVGATVEIVVSAAYAAGDAPTISYPAGWVRDAAGNQAVAGTNRAVAVVPLAVSAPMRLVNMTNLTESGSAGAGWDYKATSGADYSGYGASTTKIPAGAEGYFELRQPSAAVSIAILALKTTSASQAHTAFAYACQPLLPGQGSQRYIQFSGGGAGAAPNGATVLTAVNQWYRVGTRINGANLDGYIEVTSDNGATFALVHTWANIPKVDYYCGVATGSSANNATNLRSLGAS